jgi:hypothetical protein
MHSVAQVTSLGSFIGGASRRCTHSPRFVVRPIRSPNALGRSVVAPCFHQLEVSWVWGFCFFINANHPALRRRCRPLREPRSCRRGSAQKVPTSGHTMLTLASLAWHPLDRLTMLCHSRSRCNLLSAWIRRRLDPALCTP